MSDQELTKWKNKFRLWMALHPNNNPCSCACCPHYIGRPAQPLRQPGDLPRGYGSGRCPSKILAIVPHSLFRYTLKFMANAPNMETIGCAEWIKHV